MKKNPECQNQRSDGVIPISPKIPNGPESQISPYPLAKNRCPI